MPSVIHVPHTISACLQNSGSSAGASAAPAPASPPPAPALTLWTARAVAVHTVAASPAFQDHAAYAAAVTAASRPSARTFLACDLPDANASCASQKSAYAAAGAQLGSGAPSKNTYDTSPHRRYVAAPPASAVSAVSARPSTARSAITRRAPWTPNATRASAGKDRRYDTAGLASASRYGDAISVPAAVEAATCHHTRGAMVLSPQRANPMGTANSAAATAAQTQYAHAVSPLSVTGTRGNAKAGSTGSPRAVVSSPVASSTSNAKNARASKPRAPAAAGTHDLSAPGELAECEPRRGVPERFPRATRERRVSPIARRSGWNAAAADRTALGASLGPARWRSEPRNTLHALIRRMVAPMPLSARGAAPAEAAFGSAARTRRTPSLGRKGVHADAIGMAMAAEARRLLGSAGERGGREVRNARAKSQHVWGSRRGIRAPGVSASRRSAEAVDARVRNRPEI